MRCLKHDFDTASTIEKNRGFTYDFRYASSGELRSGAVGHPAAGKDQSQRWAGKTLTVHRLGIGAVLRRKLALPTQAEGVWQPILIGTAAENISMQFLAS